MYNRPSSPGFLGGPAAKALLKVPGTTSASNNHAWGMSLAPSMTRERIMELAQAEADAKAAKLLTRERIMELAQADVDAEAAKPLTRERIMALARLNPKGGKRTKSRKARSRKATKSRKARGRKARK